jgi:hypothetical protein
MPSSLILVIAGVTLLVAVTRGVCAQTRRTTPDHPECSYRFRPWLGCDGHVSRRTFIPAPNHRLQVASTAGASRSTTNG